MHGDPSTSNNSTLSVYFPAHNTLQPAIIGDAPQSEWLWDWEDQDDGRPARPLCCLYSPINPRQTCSVNVSQVSLWAGWLALKMVHALAAGTKESHMLVHYHGPRDRANNTVTLYSKYPPVAVTRKLNSIFFHIFTDLRLGWYSCMSWSPKSTPPMVSLYRLITRAIWYTVPSRQVLFWVLKTSSNRVKDKPVKCKYI